MRRGDWFRSMWQWVAGLISLNFAFANAYAKTVEVRFLAWDQRIAERSLDVRIGEDTEVIEGLHHLRRSKPIRIARPDPEFPEGKVPVLADSGAIPGEEMTFLPLRIPMGVEQPLVLLIPSSESPLGLQARIVEDDPNEFPWGSFRIFNTSKRELLLVTKNQQLRLPGGWEPVPFELSAEENEAVVIALEDSNDDFKILYTSIWMPDPRTRRLVMIVPSEDSRLGVIALRVIPEFRSATTVSSETSER